MHPSTPYGDLDELWSWALRQDNMLFFIISDDKVLYWCLNTIGWGCSWCVEQRLGFWMFISLAVCWSLCEKLVKHKFVHLSAKSMLIRLFIDLGWDKNWFSNASWFSLQWLWKLAFMMQNNLNSQLK